MPGFPSFLVMVLSDAALRDELLAAPDLATLTALVRERGRERGIEISAEELQGVANTNRRSWVERWTDQ
jgi:post-segregation antitoxin (ccd killing protein)